MKEKGIKLRPIVLESERNRLMEIRFYMILKDLFQKPNLNTLLLIENLAPVFHYNQDIVLDLARTIYMRKPTEIVPTKQEMLVTLYRLDMSVKDIIKKMRTHSATLYDALRRYTDDFQPMYNATQPDVVIKEIEKFVAGIYSIYECAIEGLPQC
jgi:hypothetical protein